MSRENPYILSVSARPRDGRIGTGRGGFLSIEETRRCREMQNVSCADWSDDMWDEWYELTPGMSYDDRDLRRFDNPRVHMQTYNVKQRQDYCKFHNLPLDSFDHE